MRARRRLEGRQPPHMGRCSGVKGLAVAGEGGLARRAHAQVPFAYRAPGWWRWWCDSVCRGLAARLSPFSYQNSRAKNFRTRFDRPKTCSPPRYLNVSINMYRWHSPFGTHTQQQLGNRSCWSLESTFRFSPSLVLSFFCGTLFWFRLGAAED